MALIFFTYLDDTLLEDEPIGLSDFEMDLTRDNDFHGIGFEASIGKLEFIGDGAAYLRNIKETQGLTASVTLTVKRSCDSGETWEILVQGKISMSELVENCGDKCTIEAPTDSSTCETTFKNRWDQAVNLDSTVAFDGTTVLTPYVGLGFRIPLPARKLDYISYGQGGPDAGGTDTEKIDFRPPGQGSKAFICVRPDYNVIDSNINQTNLSSSTGATMVGYNGPHGILIPVSAQVAFFEDNQACFPSPFTVNGRQKCYLTLPGATAVDVYTVCMIGEMVNEDFTDPNNRNVPNGNQFLVFDTVGINLTSPNRLPIDFSWPLNYQWTPRNNTSEGLYMFVYIKQSIQNDFHGQMDYDPETYFKVEGTKQCPATYTDAYLVHEALSRTVEAVTNNCMKVRSDFYGRKDALPYNQGVDACGGLRMFTSGMKIRNADKAVFSVSPKDLLTGLRNIDCIGMGVEQNTNGDFILRVEELKYFYQDKEIYRMPGVKKGSTAYEISRFVSTLKYGYANWQTQTNYGNDEPNATREARTGLTSISTALDITCQLVTAGSVIEVTREQQYAETNDQDSKFDENVFLICLQRDSVNTLFVELGGITNAAGVYSPDSVYNFRISPARILLRWFKVLINSYPNVDDPAFKIFFTKGAGNFTCSGWFKPSDPCTLEAFAIPENLDASIGMFKKRADGLPLFKNETFTTEDYPMSLNEYQNIKADPYGYVSYECGGVWEKGYITSLKYKAVQGTATLTLRKAW